MAPHPFSPSQNPIKTREDLANALTTGFLDPLAPHTSPNGARVKIGHTGTHYDEDAAQLEGFARPLWGLASLLAGGGSYKGTDRWVRGLAAGTDPQQPQEYWGTTRDRDQRMVEMSPIGFALAMATNALWNPLEEKDKQNVVTWINGINIKEMPDTNWLWFRVFGNLGLAKVGAPHDRVRMLKDLDHLDTFYLGEGWSRDGPEGVRQLDYYSGSFAIQYAQLVYAKLAGEDDPVRAQEYKERAARFAVDFLHYFDENGAAIPFGRSTTYRMAMAAFWAALAFTFTTEDMETLLPPYLSNPGVIKGLLFRNLRWWSSHHKSIFQSDGTLSIGYVYPNMYFTENYNSPGSPYWGMKAFLVLALPGDHPFWIAPELPHPLSGSSTPLPVVYPIKHPLHIMVRAKHHTYLLSTGQACHYPLKATQAKYGKFSYSATFGFCVPTGSYMLDQHALDGMIGFSDDGGEIWRSRRIVDEARIEMLGAGTWPVLAGTWDVFGDGEVKCETWLVPPPPAAGGVGTGKDHWYVRVHRLSVALGTRHLRNGKLLSAEGSWAVYGQGADGRILNLTDATEASNLDVFEGRSVPDVAGGAAYAVSAAGAVGIKDLLPQKRAAEVLSVDSNASLIWPRTVLPTLRGEHVAGDETWFVTGVFGRSVVGGWKKEWDAVLEENWNGLVPKELQQKIVLV